MRLNATSCRLRAANPAARGPPLGRGSLIAGSFGAYVVKTARDHESDAASEAELGEARARASGQAGGEGGGGAGVDADRAGELGAEASPDHLAAHARLGRLDDPAAPQAEGGLPHVPRIGR